MHRRCVLRMDGTDTGFRSKVAMLWLYLDGWGLPDVSWDAIRCRGRRVGKRRGSCGRDDGSSQRGSEDPRSVKSLRMRSRRNWTTGAVSAA